MSGFVTSPMVTMTSSKLNTETSNSFTRISSSTDPVTTVTVTVVTGLIEIGSFLFYVVTIAGSIILILPIIMFTICVAMCFLTTNKDRACLHNRVKNTRQLNHDAERVDSVQTEMQGINYQFLTFRLIIRYYH